MAGSMTYDEAASHLPASLQLVMQMLGLDYVTHRRTNVEPPARPFTRERRPILERGEERVVKSRSSYYYTRSPSSAQSIHLGLLQHTIIYRILQ